MGEIAKTADQALAILIELADKGPLTAPQIGKNLGLNRTVAHRLLSTLHRRGFVTRRSHTYRLGAVILHMAATVEPELRAIASESMAELGARVSETVTLHVVDGLEAIVLEQFVPRANVVRVEHAIGSRHSLARGASGRALLAYLDEPLVAQVAKAAENPELLHTQINEVRTRGYAISYDELQTGVAGIAVPLFVNGQQIFGSLGVIVPTARSEALLDHLTPLRATAANISSILRGEEWPEKEGP